MVSELRIPRHQAATTDRVELNRESGPAMSEGVRRGGMLLARNVERIKERMETT